MLLCACAFAIAGCGNQVVVQFTGFKYDARRHTTTHKPVVVRVGAHVAAQKSVGACWPPTSTNTRVLAPQKPYPHTPHCTPDHWPFTAVVPGQAQLVGQLPCHGTECMAQVGRIPVVVKRR